MTDPVAAVDGLVAALAPDVRPPAVRRRAAVLVTGPWLAGSSSVAAALRDRRPGIEFVESEDLRPGEAPLAVLLVASAVAPMTESDCAVLDAAAANTDVVIGVVSKIDAHRNWRDVLDADRAVLSAHSSRYADVPWVPVAAAPDLGDPRCDELLAVLDSQLADTTLVRRNRLRAWETRLESAARQAAATVDGAGREARVTTLGAERADALRAVRVGKTERTIALRSQIQQARLQLSYLARNRCNSVRTELQEDASELTRRGLPEFGIHVEQRVRAVLDEVSDGITAHLTGMAAELGLPPETTAAAVPARPEVGAPPLRSRRLETRLMVAVGSGFGLGVALTLSRPLSRLFADLAPGLAAAGGIGCALIGVAAAVWMVGTRGLLHDRAVLDRWVGEVIAGVRAALDQLVATRVLAAEMSMTSALTRRVETEHARAGARIKAIDTELREHAVARAHAVAARERALPGLRSALATVRRELGQTDAPAAADGHAVSVQEVAEDMVVDAYTVAGAQRRP